MELLIAFVAGAVVALLAARAMAHPPAQQEGHAQSPTARLQALTGALAAVGDASSHPRDLSANATFQEAVAILGSDVVPMSVVMDYAAGANFMLSTAACAALCERPDRDAASTLMDAPVPPSVAVADLLRAAVLHAGSACGRPSGRSSSTAPRIGVSTRSSLRCLRSTSPRVSSSATRPDSETHCPATLRRTSRPPKVSSARSSTRPRTPSWLR